MSAVPCSMKNGGFLPCMCPIELAAKAFSGVLAIDAPGNVPNAVPLTSKASVTAGDL